MCGICGWIGGGPVRQPERVVAAMSGVLTHRGPDGHGALRISAGDRAEGWLGHRRLNVIDLTHAADQPMVTPDGRWSLVFNGEIYNFAEIRADLERQGHRFRSTGDTEVLLKAFVAYGETALERLEGMFALALWDAREATLLLARDRTGKKPLFYALADRRLTFGSEPKALIAAPWIAARPDPTHVAELLAFGTVAAPATLLDGVRQVPAAGALRFAADRCRVQERIWWHPPTGPSRRLDAGALDEVRDRVDAGVRRRLVSDVPLGALLSGGIDSSLVVALMQRHVDRPVRTFSAGLVGAGGFDERPKAAAVADHLGTAHTAFEVRADASRLLDHLVALHDGPFGDSSAIPTFLVCEAARREVTVVLTGDGGDEVFAGYQRFAAAAVSRLLNPDRAAALERLAPLLPDAGYFAPRRRLRRLLAAADLPLEDRYLRWISIFPPDEANGLAPGGLRSDAAYTAAFASAGHRPPVDRILHANFLRYLPDDLQVKLDRCSMAHGLEARSPLLDTAVIEFMATVPARDKVGFARPKPVLRKAFGPLLPAWVWRRAKHGFGAPIDAWFDGELGERYRDEVLALDGRARDWICIDALTRMSREHGDRGTRHGARMWTILTLERWLRTLVTADAAPATSGVEIVDGG